MVSTEVVDLLKGLYPDSFEFDKLKRTPYNDTFKPKVKIVQSADDEGFFTQQRKTKQVKEIKTYTYDLPMGTISRWAFLIVTDDLEKNGFGVHVIYDTLEASSEAGKVIITKGDIKLRCAFYCPPF
jgi:hypothetical protein